VENNTQITSLSIMAGTTACQLSCPYCISKTTFTTEQPRLDSRRLSFLIDKFRQACPGLPYGIITGKGEPTLFDILPLIRTMHARGLIPELQTNGVGWTKLNLAEWAEAGLNTLAISLVSERCDANSNIMGKEWDPVDDRIRYAIELGLLVRLTVPLVKGGLDSWESVKDFLEWAHSLKVQQVTFRKVGVPRPAGYPTPDMRERADQVVEWVRNNSVDPELVSRTMTSFMPGSVQQEPLPWAKLWTWSGMSIMLTDCMTAPKGGVVRHAVIQPDGHLYGSWEDPGHILI
jgi:pyruvate-formate lyase-activating enzyme